MAKDYNATLNLPKTDFPMRAGLPKREPEMLGRWLEQDIYNEMLRKNEGKPRFKLCPDRGLRTKSFHRAGDDREDMVDIRVGVVLADGQAQGAVGQLMRDAEAQQHMTRVE